MKGRRLQLLLAISLAVNLFLLGLMASSTVFRDRERAREPRRGSFAAAVEQLDPADADALRTLMRERGERAEPRVRALRDARKEAQALMSRPEYDPAAVRAAMTRVRVEEMALRNDLDASLIEFATRLEPEERAAIAPLMRRGGRGWRGDRHAGKPERGRGEQPPEGPSR